MVLQNWTRNFLPERPRGVHVFTLQEDLSPRSGLWVLLSYKTKEDSAMRLRGVAGAASVCCVCLLLLLTTKHDSEEGENPVVLVPRGGREIGSSGRASSAYDGLIK